MKRKNYVFVFMVLIAMMAAATIAEASQTIRKQEIIVERGQNGVYHTLTNRSYNIGAKAMTSLTYKSSAPDVVSVDKNGNIRTYKKGTAQITVTAKKEKGYQKAVKRIKYYVRTRPQLFHVKPQAIKKGEVLEVKLNGIKTSFTVKSDDTSLVKITGSGKESFSIKGVSEGKTWLTIIAVGSDVYAPKTKRVLVRVNANNVVKVPHSVTGVHEANIRAVAPLLPENILNAFEKLNFTVIIDPKFYVNGLCSYTSRTITLREEDDTIYHEMGHFISFVALKYCDKEEFKEIFLKEKGKFPGAKILYASQNPTEYFAECTREYILNKSRLKAACPETFKAIEKCIAEIDEGRIQLYKKFFKNYGY